MKLIKLPNISFNWSDKVLDLFADYTNLTGVFILVPMDSPTPCAVEQHSTANHYRRSSEGAG
jgi:hypothetical protein